MCNDSDTEVTISVTKSKYTNINVYIRSYSKVHDIYKSENRIRELNV